LSGNLCGFACLGDRGYTGLFHYLTDAGFLDCGLLCRLTGDFTCRGLIGIERWVEQYRKFTQHSPLGPVGLNQEVKKRLFDRTLGRNQNDCPLSILAFLDREPQFRQVSCACESGAGKCFAGCKTDQQIVDLAGSSRYDFDLGIKGLIEE